MNEHVALVKKWLADHDSVSKEELKANKAAAYTAYDAAYAAYDAAAYDAAANATYAAAYAANAAYWVGIYEDLTNE